MKEIRLEVLLLSHIPNINAQSCIPSLMMLTLKFQTDNNKTHYQPGTLNRQQRKGKGVLGPGIHIFMFLIFIIHLWYIHNLSSPRAESARAVSGRRCPHSGEGEDFLTGQLDFFTKTAGMESRKIYPKVGNERSLRGLQMGH